MSFYDYHGFIADSDTLFGNVGFGIDHRQVPSEPTASLKSETIVLEPRLDAFHDGADLTDLRSSLHDIDPLPAHLLLDAHNASVHETRPEPWSHGRVSDCIRGHTRRHAPLQTNDATEDDQQQLPGSAHNVGGLAEAHGAHSSTDGISQWADLSFDKTSFGLSSFNIHSVDDGSSQRNTPVTPLSQQSTRPLDSSSATSSHVCFSCGKSFAKRSGVKHHERIHDPAKKRAHRCPDCDLGFQNPKDMRRHRKIHNKERELYPCTDAGCSKLFTREDNVARHLATAHTSSS